MDTLPFVKWTKRQGVRLFSSVGRKTKMQTKKCLHFGEEERRNRWEMAFWIKKAVANQCSPRRRGDPPEIRTPDTLLKRHASGGKPPRRTPAAWKHRRFWNLDVPVRIIEHPALYLLTLYHLTCSRNKMFQHFRTTSHIFHHPAASQSIFHAVCIIFLSSKSKREYENFDHSTVIWESGRFIIRL